MSRRILAGFLLVLALTVAIPLHAGEELKSGPQPGTVLATAFHPFNINGQRGKGRYHCLVCEFGLNPVVMVLARERIDGKDEALTDLLKRLDEAVGRYEDSFLKSFVVFLSADARSSATEPKIEDTEKLVTEATAREALLTRLGERAKDLKQVVVSCLPLEGPKDYNLADKAEVTVLLYAKHKVVANFAFEEGKLSAEGVAQIMKSVDDLVGKVPRKPAPPKENPEPKTEPQEKVRTDNASQEIDALSLRTLALALPFITARPQARAERAPASPPVSR